MKKYTSVCRVGFIALATAVVSIGVPRNLDAADGTFAGAALVTVTCGPAAASHDPYRSATSTGNESELWCNRTAGVRVGAARP